MTIDPFYTTLPVLLLATGIGYLLGALPIADRVSRRRDIDIFSAGTGLAGATNVRRQVGKVPSAIVVLGDFGKGVLAVIVADLLGVDKGSVWILLPAAAAIIGHWKSIFTGFRGGDALVTLGGIIIALFPVTGFISVAVASIVAFSAQRLPFSSLLNIVFGYLALATIQLLRIRRSHGTHAGHGRVVRHGAGLRHSGPRGAAARERVGGVRGTGRGEQPDRERGLTRRSALGPPDTVSCA